MFHVSFFCFNGGSRSSSPPPPCRPTARPTPCSRVRHVAAGHRRFQAGAGHLEANCDSSFLLLSNRSTSSSSSFLPPYAITAAEARAPNSPPSLHLRPIQFAIMPATLLRIVEARWHHPTPSPSPRRHHLLPRSSTAPP
jgi:hypothetical protein